MLEGTPGYDVIGQVFLRIKSVCQHERILCHVTEWSQGRAEYHGLSPHVVITVDAAFFERYDGTCVAIPVFPPDLDRHEFKPILFFENDGEYGVGMGKVHLFVPNQVFKIKCINIDRFKLLSGFLDKVGGQRLKPCGSLRQTVADHVTDF